MAQNHVLKDKKIAGKSADELIRNERWLEDPGIVAVEEGKPDDGVGSPKKHQQILVLFIHGLGSNSGVWSKFTTLLKSDPDLRDFCVPVTYRYPTKIFRLLYWKKIPRVDQIAEGLATELKHKYHEYMNVVLVGHSLGGLVARRYIVDALDKQQELRTKAIYLYATPNNGADLAAVGRSLSWWNPHIRQLCRNSEFLQHLDNDWGRLKPAKKISVTYVLGAQDSVIPEDSPKVYGNDINLEVIADKGHTSVVQPKNHGDVAYCVLKNGLTGMRASNCKF